MMERPQLIDRGVFRFATGGLCVLTGLSAAAVLGLALLSRPVSWFLGGFELVILFASAIGLLCSMGRFREGPAMVLLCVAGTVGVGSLLGYVGAAKLLMGWSLKPYLVARMLDAALLALAAAAVVLSRSPAASLSALGRSAAFTAAMVLTVGSAWVFRGTIGASPGPARVALLTLLGVSLIVLVSASGHYLIRAFAAGAKPTGGPPA